MVDTQDPTQAVPHAPARGQRLWAVLLVLDAFFVIVFGGALAAKIYNHLQAPAPAVPTNAHRPRPPKPPEPAKTPEPAKPAENPKPAPAPKAPAAPKTGMPPPKPSLLNEAPRREAAKPHEAAKPREAPKAAAVPDAADAKVKAVAVNFQLSAPGAKSVELAGPFIVRGGGRKEMKNHDGQWTITLYLTPNTYRYHFLVDGKKTLDPQNPKTDRGASVVSVP